jgi:hypothetical protein
MLRQRKPLTRKTPLRSKSGLKRGFMKRKGRKPPTAAQKRRHDLLRKTGCVICFRYPHIHHIREGLLGMGQAVDHDRVLPLCYDHHQSETTGAISLHGTPREFKEAFGTELELEQKLKERFEINNS